MSSSRQQTARYGEKGAVWAPEWRDYKDSLSGVSIRQLTNYKGHNHHVYFTDTSWYDQGRKILFMADRGNYSNIFSLDMASGEITQMTELGSEGDNVTMRLGRDGSKAYYRAGEQVVELDLQSLRERVMFQGERGINIRSLNCTADGKYLVVALAEDLSRPGEFVFHRDMFKGKPRGRIMLIPIGEGETKLAYEYPHSLGHVNPSPTQPHLMTFCFDGSWDKNKIEHRIWGLDLSTGNAWKIREYNSPGERVSHEYWSADGLHIGYHGYRENGTAFFGKIKYDNTDMEETEFPFRNWHSHSIDFSQVVVDGREPRANLIYWKRVNGVYSAPRILCEHRCSSHVQNVHVHPRFTDDGKQSLFCSDKGGYGNLYLVDIPDDHESLPLQD